MIYLLTGILIILFICLYLQNEHDITSPAVIFCLSFVILCVVNALFGSVWYLNLHWNTFLVVAGGVFEFALAAALTRKLYFSIQRRIGVEVGIYKNRPKKIKAVHVQRWKLMLFLIFCVGVIAAYAYYEIKVTGAASLTAAARIMDNTKFTGDTIVLPRWIVWARDAVIASSFWFAYVISTKILADRKVPVMESLIFLCSIAASMMNGARGLAVREVLALIVMLLILHNRQNKTNYNVLLPVNILRIVLVLVVFMILFRYSALLMGRSIGSNSVLHYLSIYCGAQLKNLDTFLNGKKTVPFISGGQTFRSILNYVRRKSGLGTYALDLPFLKIRGYSLGNVYTTFYPYIYDYGYIGEVVLVFIMSCISQIFFIRAGNCPLHNHPPFSILIYSEIFGALLLSFFSNKFYEILFSVTLIRYIVWWIVFDFLFGRLRFER